jgi:hypothetical protein
MRLFVEILIALTLVGLLVGVLLYNRKQPRLLVDGLIALLLVGVLVCVMLFRTEEDEVSRHYQTVRDALAVLHEQAFYHSVLGKDDDDEKGFPQTMSPLWFRAEGVPINPSVPGRQPWLDIAPAGDESYHPPDPVITESHQAGFWYNPNLGIFRARVVPQWSATATLDLYNELNGVVLDDLKTSHDPARMPLPLLPVTIASMGRQQADESPDEVQQEPPRKKATLINTAPEKAHILPGADSIPVQ